MIKRANTSNKLINNDNELVADFHAALLGLITADLVVSDASTSETVLENALRINKPQNGIYVTANDISDTEVETLSRLSIDAHLKKVQAEQIQTYASTKISQQQEQLSAKYKNKKIHIDKITDAENVFIPLWDDNNSGRLREGTFNGASLQGTIIDLSIEKNIVLIKPTFLWRKIQPTRKFFLVTVVNLDTMTPNIKVRRI